jgi:hypothetical protein
MSSSISDSTASLLVPTRRTTRHGHLLRSSTSKHSHGTFDHTSLNQSLWLPSSADAGGSPSAFPAYPQPSTTPSECELDAMRHAHRALSLRALAGSPALLVLNLLGIGNVGA